MKPFKVVCINASPIETENWIHEGTGLVEGEIYTSSTIPFYFTGFLAINIIELNNNPKLYCRFRPVQDIGSSVEEHINKLIKEEDLKTISV